MRTLSSLLTAALVFAAGTALADPPTPSYPAGAPQAQPMPQPRPQADQQQPPTAAPPAGTGVNTQMSQEQLDAGIDYLTKLKQYNELLRDNLKTQKDVQDLQAGRTPSGAAQQQALTAAQLGIPTGPEVFDVEGDGTQLVAELKYPDGSLLPVSVGTTLPDGRTVTEVSVSRVRVKDKGGKVSEIPFEPNPFQATGNPGMQTTPYQTPITVAQPTPPPG